VLVENGGHGGATAAPVARLVMDYHLLGKLPEEAAAKTIPEDEEGAHD
jgi:penicillin-binding protein 2